MYAFENKNYAPQFTFSYTGQTGVDGSINPVDLGLGNVVYSEDL